MMPIVEAILVALVENVGAPALLQWLVKRTPQDQAQAILDAEYKTARAAADAEATAVLPKP